MVAAGKALHQMTLHPSLVRRFLVFERRLPSPRLLLLLTLSSSLLPFPIYSKLSVTLSSNRPSTLFKTRKYDTISFPPLFLSHQPLYITFLTIYFTCIVSILFRGILAFILLLAVPGFSLFRSKSIELLHVANPVIHVCVSRKSLEANIQSCPCISLMRVRNRICELCEIFFSFASLLRLS